MEIKLTMKPKRINGLCPLMNLNLLPVSRKKKPLPKPITRRCSVFSSWIMARKTGVGANKKKP
jgi:hypothetical protein